MVNRLLQNNDLSYLRDEVIKTMPDTVNIQRQSRVSDGQGGFTTNWSNAYQNVAARITPSGGSESIDAGRQDLQADAMLTITYDQSIEQTDRVIHSSGTYEVRFIEDGKTWSTAKRCQMRRL